MSYKFLIPTLSQEQTRTAVNDLQRDLYLLNDLALTLKHAHWNVTGPNFIAVHEMLDPQIDEVRDGVDEIAERIAALGGSPQGLSCPMVEKIDKKLPHYPVEGRAATQEHLKAVDEQLTAVETILRESVAILDETDFVSSNVIQDALGKLEQFQWKVRSHLA